jgi:3-dehydroquinate synthase
MTEVTTIRVGGPTPYDVCVGAGVSTDVVRHTTGASVVAVARPAALAGFAAPVIAALSTGGHRAVEVDVPSGEDGKSLESLMTIWDALAAAGVGRGDAVVAVGGGATTDVVGFAAATWLRGVRVVQVPTTLLGMVDAAVGGKTAINTPAGKNLVGAFHPPAAVLVDLDTLETLPAGEWVNGMAEVVKAGFIADPRILELVEAAPGDARRPGGGDVRELVERAIRVKVDVVSADLRESGRREFLNYGHTLAHAIERVEHFRWPHGHAVSVGLVFAAALGRHAGRLDPATAERHRTVLDAVGLPTSYPDGDWAALREAMNVDKKSRGGMLRFVVLDGLATPGILDGPDEDLLRAAFAEVS